MLFNKISWMVAASCVALTALLLFQVNWLQHSRQLIEEQFDQKVTMAMCSAVEEMGRKHHALAGALIPGEVTTGAYQAQCLPANVDEAALTEALRGNLQRYGIDYDFQYSIQSNALLPLPAAVYCSSMAPLADPQQTIQLRMMGRDRYVIKKLGLMVGSSIFFLLAVCGLFVLTMVRFLRQHRLNAISIDFFNNMAHEFRTPLTNIRLASGLLKKRQPGIAENRFMEVIDQESKRLLEQVERILHVAKLERGEYQLDLETIQADELLKEVVAEMRFLAAERGGHIEFRGATPSGLTISGDRLHLSNAIRNLIDNALKYCEEVPAVGVDLSREDGFARFSFSDNGTGIGDKQQRSIFDQFRRGNVGDRHNVKGFGLGLAYVRQVVEMHNGKIQLESEPGQGSTFHILLPLA